MNFQLPSLKYSYYALAPKIDPLTMEIHYTKHHQGYVTNLNNALTTHFPEGFNYSITEVLTNFSSLPPVVQPAVKNHGGGHANHSMFWATLSPEKTLVPPQLLKAVEQHFESWQNFHDQFVQVAKSIFGSGWGWLVYCPQKEQLLIVNTPNQDSPLMQGLIPVLGIDVWEHAYYLTYQNRRPDYVDAFWELIDWNMVWLHLKHAQKTKRCWSY